MNNISNKLISTDDLNKIINGNLTVSTANVNNVNIFHQSFVHKSFLIKDSFIDEEDGFCAFYMEKPECNERLEFLGDSVLNMVTAEYLFEKFPEKDEGFLTKMRTKLVRNTQLSYIGSKLGFNKWLLISSYIERIGGRENPRLIEDVFESFIASLFKDQGFYITREFIFTCFDKYVDLNHLVEFNDNYKDTLLRYFQINTWSHPVYECFISDTSSSVKSFTTAVLVSKELCQSQECIEIDLYFRQKFNVDFKDYLVVGTGTGDTKKKSQQVASQSALEALKVPKNF